MSQGGHGSFDTSFERDLDAESLLDDCRRVLSDVVQEEEVLEKKRRWLMGLPIDSKKSHKKLKISKFLRNSYLPESYVRNDDVSLEDIRMLIDRPFKSYTGSKGFECSDPDPKKAIEEDPPESPARLHGEDHFERMNMLSEILSNAGNLDSTVSSSLTSSVGEALEILEVLPSQALIAMDRKLKNVTAVPQFAVAFSGKRGLLIRRLRKQCGRILPKLKHGSQLPVPLAKALSVMCLSVKAKTRRADIVTKIFFPFSAEVQGLQNELLEAIWFLPKVKRPQWKRLRCLVAPKLEFSPKSFQKSLHNYMMEYLFYCDDLQLPRPLSMALKLINQETQRQPASVGSAEEEMESVLDVSSQLRQIVWESLPDKDADQEFARYAEGLGIPDSSTIEVLDMDCSLFAIHDYVKFPISYSDGVEGSGDSMPHEPPCQAFDSEGGDSAQPAEGKGGGACNSKADATNWYEALQNICDDASMVAYKATGLLLDEFGRKEGKKAAGEADPCCLGGGVSSTSNYEDPEKRSDILEISSATLHRVFGELTPSLPESVIKRFEKLLRSL